MPLIAVTPTTVYSTHPIFISCNGSLLGLGDIPMRIKDPPISDVVASPNAQCGNERTYHSSLMGTQTNSMITEVKEIKEEPGTNSAQTPLPPVTLPVAGQGSSTCAPVEVKTEPSNTDETLEPLQNQDGSTRSNTDETLEPRQNQDGSTPCNIEFVNVQNNPDLIKIPRRTRCNPWKTKSTVPILPKPTLDIFGNLVPYEDYHVMPPEWQNSDGIENRPVKKKSKCPANIGRLREEIFPVTQTPGGDVETYQNRRMCPYCCTTYSKRHVMVHHFQKFHKNHYLCKKCNYIYESQDILDEHYEFHKKNPMPYKCTKCKMKYKHQWGLEQHYIREHSTVEPEAVGDIEEQGGLSYYEETQVKLKTFTCSKCDNVYSLQTHLRAHERITHGVRHRKAKEFKCTICTKSYSGESSFQHHVEMHNQRYTCNECGKVFKEKYHVRLHMRKHTGERPYQCKFCPKTFTQSNSCRVHMLTHTGLRPYVCNVCDRGFTQRSTLVIHHRKHPGNHPLPPPVYINSFIKDD